VYCVHTQVDGAVQLFRAFVFDARDKSFLVPMLRRDWLRAGAHLPSHWSLWNSHTLSHRVLDDVIASRDLYATCCADSCAVQSVIAGNAEWAEPADGVMNNHEVVCDYFRASLLDVHFDAD